MNKKHLLLALAMPALIVACTNDELLTNGNIAQGDMMSTKDINLVFNRGTGDADTRAVWTDGTSFSFYWENKTASVLEQSIGLAYVGTGTTGVTNYKFDADSLRLYNYKAKGSTRWTGFYEIGEGVSSINGAYSKNPSGDYAIADIDTSRQAKFKTVNDQIMRGNYVAYYPFNAEYQDPGSIIVTSPKNITMDLPAGSKNANLAKLNLDTLGKSTFSYSAPTKLEPGSQVTYMDMKNLSSIIKLEITGSKINKEIKKIYLRAQGNDAFILEGTLNDPAVAPSASNVTSSKTTPLLEVVYLTRGLNFLTAGTTASAYIPFIPTLFNGGFDVILVGSDNMACVINHPFGSGTFAPAAGMKYTLKESFDDKTLFDQRFVTNGDEFKAAVAAAKASASKTTINVLGDIEVNGFDMTGTTIADWKGGLDVTGAGTITFKGVTNIGLYLKDGDTAPANNVLTFDLPVTFEGATSILGEVVLNGTTNINAALIIGKANSATDYYPGYLTINGKTTVSEDGSILARYSKGTTISATGELIIEDGATFTNDAWSYSTPTVTYKSDLIIVGSMSINAGAKLLDYGDTEIQTGGTLSVLGYAENYNTLNCAGTFSLGANATLYNYAQHANYSTNYRGNGNIKIVAGGTLSTDASSSIMNSGSLNMAGTFSNNGTFNDYVGSYYGGLAYVGTGAYVCYVNDNAKITEAVTKLKAYATGKEQRIVLMNNPTEYTLAGIADADAANLNIEVQSGTVKLSGISSAKTFNSINVNASAVARATGTTVTIGNNFKFSGASFGKTPMVISADAEVIFENGITVKANGAIDNKGIFNLKNAENSSKLPAKVYCKSATLSTGTWVNYPTIDSTGSFWN